MKATDPAIQRTRDARERISASVGDDPTRLVEYYIETQKRFGTRLRRGPSDNAQLEHQLPADAQKDARR